VDSVEADGWLGDLLAGADDRRLRAIATPEGFAGELRPYQQRGLGWLAFLGDLGLGACLADDMGLGKTAQLLALLVDERTRSGEMPARRAPTTGTTTKRRSAGPKLAPTLVLCPMSLVGNWQRESARFAPKLSVYVHHGPDRLDGKAFSRHAATVDLVLSTYGLAARDQQLLATVPWRRMVLDEAQQIKNSAARTTQSVRAIPAERRIAMTGTPVENRLSELWSIMHFLNPGMLGSEKAFRERFAVPIERDGDDEAAARLRRITGPFVLRRLKTDRSIIADLPDKLEMREYCNLTREQATLYQAVVDDMLARIDEAEGIDRRGLVLATMMKLKQVCNHPAHFLGDGSSVAGRSGKVSRLVEVLEEAVAEGDRSLVFTQFTQMGDMLERHLRRRLGCEVLWLHGGVPKKKRDAMVEQFQGTEGAPVFLLSLKAGGTGLNLTAATNVVHFDRWWNPAVEDQATDRAFRIGQHRNVQVRKFVCGGTLEERIDTMIEAKRALADRIVGSGEGWITELSTEQLREIVALSADDVGED
jgi:SNF2 family DNA or RNA helicase